jgi:shikimate kinase
MTTREETFVDPKALGATLKKPIVLVGMMGAGKSHIGQRLATALQIDFFDSDALIEQKAGLTIAGIFEKFGEGKFRQAEKNTVLECLEKGRCVLATGGGALTNSEILSAIKEKGVSVWIKARIDEILERVGDASSRPLLRSGDPKVILENLMKQREPLYSQADIVIDSVQGRPDETLKNLINSLYTHLNRDNV